MMDGIAVRRQQLERIQHKIKHQPLVQLPFEDRDLLRFPSLMDDRKTFNKVDYLEGPLRNSVLQKRNRLLNGESAQDPINSFYDKNARYFTNKPVRKLEWSFINQSVVESPRGLVNETSSPMRIAEELDLN